MGRVEFTPGVKLAIVARAKDAQGIAHCEGEGCGKPVEKGEWQIDHIVSEAMAHRKRKLQPRDGQLLCFDCHRLKSEADAGSLSKAQRLAGLQGRLIGRSEIARRYGVGQDDPDD
jgi:hypothetical protein